MNRITISLLSISLVALVGVGFYFSSEPTEHDSDMTVVREHNDSLESFEISPYDVVEKVRSNEKPVLLDVRTPEEYEEVHLENALLLPVQELSQESLNRIGLGEDMKDKEIVLYCRSGARSQTAYNIMKSLGYTNIKSVAGGMIHWQEDEYPLTESGAYTGMTVESDNITETLSDGPKVDFDRMQHDFREIPQYGGIVETAFTITNSGSETLEIGALSTSCACTKATMSRKKIPTGESAVLTVVFDPDLHAEPEGVFERTVFVPTNDPTVLEAEVTIKVDIIEGQ